MEYSAELLAGLRARFAHTADPDHELVVHGNGPGSRQHRFRTDTLPELEAFCGPIDGQRVLELGCGTGSITPVLAERAASVVAFDVDEDSLDLCRRRIAEHGCTNVTVVGGDHYDPPTDPADRFDLVLLHAVMEHVPLSRPGLRAAVLRGALDALVPGGHLFIYETPNRLWPKDIHTTSLWFIPWTRPGSRWAYDRAVRAGQHRPRTPDEGTIALEERGAWGMSYFEVGRALDPSSYAVVNLEAGHDRWVRPGKALGRGRRLYETAAYHTLTKPFHVPVVAVSPMLSPLVLRRTDQGVPTARATAHRAADAADGPVVAAIVVTHDRLDVLTLTLQSLADQTVAPTQTFVVDSGSRYSDPHDLLDRFPDLRIITVGDNVGYGAALSIGIEAAQKATAPDHYWLLDDDSPVAPDALANVLALATTTHGVGIIGNRGGRLRAGLPRWYATITAEPRDADFCTVDGALLAARAVEACGTPRRDFFMMHEDLEYTTRISAAGLRVLVSDHVRNAPMHLGSAHGAPLFWRDYYQSRNHLRFVLDRRSVTGVAGWAVREAAIVGSGLRRGRAGLVKARVVLRGARDALTHTMGRTIEPGSL
jgi:GT2 family glycosyltransferase/SAM-dependent methyltransferase